MDTDVAIQVDALTFSRGDGVHRQAIFDNLNCQIRKGSITAIVGKSSVGKSSLLGLFAGMLKPQGGEINFPAGRPRIGMQFQSDALFLWRPVWSNLGYALEIRGQDRAAQRAHAAMLCRLVELDPELILDRMPGSLSGGERRRVSLALALSALNSEHVDHGLLLLDEATGNLDWLTRRQMQQMLRRIWVERELTIITVTHDVEEAIWMSDVVYCMRRGMPLAEFPVPFPRNRTDEIRTSPEFAKLVSSIAACLSGEGGTT